MNELTGNWKLSFWPMTKK